MRYRFVDPCRTRSVAAAVVETAVAAGTAMLVSVFFVSMVVFPEAKHVHTAWNTLDPVHCTDSATVTA